MVEPNVYGIWEIIYEGFKKETDSEHYKLEIELDDTIYCFLGYKNGSFSEYKYQATDRSPREICETVMKRDSHGEDIEDVVEEIGFEKL